MLRGDLLLGLFHEFLRLLLGGRHQRVAAGLRRDPGPFARRLPDEFVALRPGLLDELIAFGLRIGADLVGRFALPSNEDKKADARTTTRRQ